MIPHGTRNSKPARQARPLKRGKACMNCRFLKIKCDGVKPICGPCQAHPRDDDCEYSDGPGRSRTKVLEDTVTRLEARLQELENPESTTPSVTLHDPYHGYKTQRASRSPPSLIVDSLSAYSPLSPFSPTSTTSSLPSGSSGSSSKSPLRRSTVPIPSNSSVEVGITQYLSPGLGLHLPHEPSLQSIHSALENFMPHAEEFGFFLHQPTFRTSALLAFPSGHASRPTPGLLSAVQLMARSLSQSDAQHDQENQLLSQAIQETSSDMLSSHPNKLIHTIQAEVLLVYYFLRTGSLLLAKVHMGTAVSLSLASGLHKIRSANNPAPSIVALIHDQPSPMPMPQDTLQEAERINGFWAVFALHKMFSVALESPAHVCGALEAPGIQIDTPWPVDMEHFSEASLPAELMGNSTVRAFLSGIPTGSIFPPSAGEYLNKAATLFHRAAHLTGQWNPAMNPANRHAYETASVNVEHLIDNLRASLPPMPTHSNGEPSSASRTLLLTHALVEAAAIKLHWIWAYAYPKSKQICLSSARKLVGYYGEINLQELGHVNPIMGNLWLTACHVFIDEISRMRQLKTTYPDAVVDEEELMDCYRTGLKVMSEYSQDCTLMRYQLTKVQDAFEAI